MFIYKTGVFLSFFYSYIHIQYTSMCAPRCSLVTFLLVPWFVNIFWVTDVATFLILSIVFSTLKTGKNKQCIWQNPTQPVEPEHLVYEMAFCRVITPNLVPWHGKIKIISLTWRPMKWECYFFKICQGLSFL